MKIKSDSYAARLMREFNSELLSCDTAEDYAELVVGVLIFSKLVEQNFKEAFEKDSPNEVQDALNNLHLEAAKKAKLAVDIANQGIDIKSSLN